MALAFSVMALAAAWGQSPATYGPSFSAVAEDGVTTYARLDATGLWLNGDRIDWSSGTLHWVLPRSAGSSGQVLVTDGAGNIGWDTPTTGTFATTFTGLTDTPSVYTGKRYQVVRVNYNTDGLEFVQLATVESDPYFFSSPAWGISDEDITYWNSGGSANHPPVTLDATSSPVLALTSQTLSLQVQAHNTVWAGPATDTAATVPTFRSLVDADIPASIARATSLTLAQVATNSTSQAENTFAIDAGTVLRIGDASAGVIADFYGDAASLGYAATFIRDLRVQDVNPGFRWIDLTSGETDWRMDTDTNVMKIRADAGSDGTYELTALQLTGAGLLTVGTIDTGNGSSEVYPTLIGGPSGIAATYIPRGNGAGNPLTATSALTFNGTALYVNGNIQIPSNKYLYATGTGTILLGDDDLVKVAGALQSTKALAGTVGSLAQTDAKILLYGLTGANWAGLGADASGRAWLRTGLSAEHAFVFDTSGRLGIEDGTPDANLEAVGTLMVSSAAANDGDRFSVTTTGAGVGVAAPGKRLESRDATGAQLRLSYASGLTADFTADAAGDLLLAPSGGHLYTASALQLGNSGAPVGYNRLGNGTTIAGLDDAFDLMVGDDLEVVDDVTVYGDGSFTGNLKSQSGLVSALGSTTVDSIANVAMTASNSGDTTIYIEAPTAKSPALVYGRNSARTWKIEDEQSSLDLEFSAWTGSAWRRSMRLENTSSNVFYDGKVVLKDQGTDGDDYAEAYVKNGQIVLHFKDVGGTPTDHYMTMDLTAADPTWDPFGMWTYSTTEP